MLTLPEIADHHAVLHRTGTRLVIVATEGETFIHRRRAAARAEVSLEDPIELGGYHLIREGEEAMAPANAGGAPGALTYYPTGPLDENRVPAGSEGTMESVTVIAGRGTGLSLPLRVRPITVGRAPDCDLVLGDDTVSWRHLVIEPSRAGARVRDPGSRNGTYVDGRRVASRDRRVHAVREDPPLRSRSRAEDRLSSTGRIGVEAPGIGSRRLRHPETTLR